MARQSGFKRFLKLVGLAVGMLMGLTLLSSILKNQVLQQDILPLEKNEPKGFLKPLSFQPNQHSGITKLRHYKAAVIGTTRPEPGYLTIGIPTVTRSNISYLEETIHSLINGTSESDRKQITTVIFVSDFNTTERDATVKKLIYHFVNYLETGFLQILTIDEKYYPRLTNLTRTFNDNDERMKWRSKQVVDFAFLWDYSIPLGKYYIQLEDDVITAPNFLPEVVKYIEECSASENWIVIEFSRYGYIAKVHKSSDLPQLANFVMLFYKQMPVDFLLIYWKMIRRQKKTYIKDPALWRHIGKVSSLNNKVQFIENGFQQLKKKD